MIGKVEGGADGDEWQCGITPRECGRKKPLDERKRKKATGRRSTCRRLDTSAR